LVQWIGFTDFVNSLISSICRRACSAAIQSIHAQINGIPLFLYRYLSCICFVVGTSMGAWLGRITCVNYYRCAIDFKAEMDWLGTYVKTQTYNVKSKILLLEIFLHKYFYITNVWKSRILHHSLVTCLRRCLYTSCW